MKKVALALALLLAGTVVMKAADRGEKSSRELERANGWTLMSMTKDGKMVPGLTGQKREATLIFKGRKYSGSGGCNSFGGKASFRDGNLSFGSMAMTEMACDDAAVMKQETMFVGLLMKMTRYEIKGKGLVLSDGTNANSLHLSPMVPPKKVTLIGTKWWYSGFEETAGESVSFTAAVGKSKVNLQFGEDGKVVGTGGVNRFFGGYNADLKKGTVEISGIGSTRMAGPPEMMKQEAMFFRHLATMTRLEISGQKLMLKDKKGKSALLFETAALGDGR